jgi:hypothetical protein
MTCPASRPIPESFRTLRSCNQSLKPTQNVLWRLLRKCDQADHNDKDPDPPCIFPEERRCIHVLTHQCVFTRTTIDAHLRVKNDCGESSVRFRRIGLPLRVSFSISSGLSVSIINIPEKTIAPLRHDLILRRRARHIKRKIPISSLM